MQKRRVLEEELGHERHIQTRLRREHDFLAFSAPQLVERDLRVTFRMAGERDLR